MKPTIPVIDLRALHEAPEGLDRVGARLAEACHEVGFCYLSGHGVSARVEEDVFAAVRAFFALDTDAKNRLSIANSPHFRGYTPFGEEFTRGRRDWREQIDLGLDEPVERAGAEDPPWKRLRGPNQWPAELPELRRAITTWTDAMERLSLTALRALAVGLGQPADWFDAFMLPRGDPHLKVIRYRGVDSEPAAAADAQGVDDAQRSGGAWRIDDAGRSESRQGVGWHNDSGVLTFILQDDVGGLEVRTPAGIVAAEPKAGTYLMNIGEMLQRATAGFLRATEHRVISPPAGRERISLAYVPHPKYESTFEPIPLPAAIAARAGGGENADPADPVYRCFGDNYLKIRLRSHPDVASRFYSDVVGA